jgi:hypothetical protein
MNADEQLRRATIVTLCLALCVLLVLLFTLAQAARCQVIENPQPRCQTVSMDEQGKLIYQDIPCSQVPNWRVLKLVQSRVTFWTMRPNRTNRQTFTSPWFYGTEAIAWGTGIATYERRVTLWSKADAFIPLAAMTGLHYASDRWIARFIGVAGAASVIGINTAGIVSRHPR